MANGQAGYTGVVYSESEAGYTAAEGYTGVVRSTTASGYTGTTSAPSAPVTTRGRSKAERIPVTPSPYDGVAADRDTAPGAEAPVDYQSAPAPVDLATSRTAEEEPRRPDPATGSLSPTEEEYVAGEDPRVPLIDTLTRDLLSVERQIQLSPDPEPNQSLARARRLVEGDLASVPFGGHPVHLLGPFAEFLDRQIAETLTQTKPNNLGVAYLQGILQEVLSTMIRAGTGSAEMALDPVGSSVDSASEVVQAIREHMAKGESFWEAVNSVLNPATRMLTEGWQANNIAGEALAAAQRGEWDLAVRLARESGRSAARGGVAAAETVDIAISAVHTSRTIRRRWAKRRRVVPPELPPPPRPSEPSSGPRPEARESVSLPRSEVDPIPVAPTSPTRPDALTGTVVHDGAAGPQLPAVELSRPHSAYPDVPVPDRGYLETRRLLQEQLLKHQQVEAANRMRALPPERRLSSQYRIGPAKAGYNSKEWLSAADLQLAHPDRGYLTQSELVSVVLPDGSEIPAHQLTQEIDPDRPGRILDVLEVRPDGTYGDVELKSTNDIRESYPAKGVEVDTFKQGSNVGREIRKTNAVFDYAKANNGRVRVRGRSLDGRAVELPQLDPALFRGTRVSSYRELPN